MHLPPPTPMTSFAPYVRASATIEPTVVSLQKPEKGWTLYSTPDSRRPFFTSGPAISHAVRPATTSARVGEELRLAARQRRRARGLDVSAGAEDDLGSVSH